jgi:hypothetical protein
MDKRIRKILFMYLASIVIGMGLVVGLASPPNPESTIIEEIQKTEKYCQAHNKPEYIWYIEGKPYLVDETPRGLHEIVGLYNRWHED